MGLPKSEPAPAIPKLACAGGDPNRRHGVLGDDPDLRLGRRRRLPLRPALLQSRPLHQPVPFNFGYHGNCVLLDDVGNCLSSTDEAIDCSDPQRRRMRLSSVSQLSKFSAGNARLRLAEQSRDSFEDKIPIFFYFEHGCKYCLLPVMKFSCDLHRRT